MKENKFQASLIKEIKERLGKDTMVLKNDSSYIQGVPDLLILHNDKWAMLEVKQSNLAKHQPNQDYYVNKLSKMSYANFIFPENKEEVLNEVQRALESRRKTRISRSK